MKNKMYKEGQYIYIYIYIFFRKIQNLISKRTEPPTSTNWGNKKVARDKIMENKKSIHNGPQR